MAGYIRQDTTGAISNNSIIEADDLNSEFDAVQGAFNAITGHKHDGTSAEGAPIEVVGPAQDVVITASTIRPKTDNAVDLGTSTLEFKDLYLDGTANIDNLVADAGTVAGAAITTVSNTQTLTNKTVNLANNTLVATSAQLAAAITDETGTGSVVFSASPTLTGTPSAPTAAAGTNTTQVATTAHVFAERTNTATLTNKTLTSPVINSGDINTPDIDGGTIDGTVIGGSTPAAISGTTGSFSGNVGIGTSSPAARLDVSVVDAGNIPIVARFRNADPSTGNDSGSKIRLGGTTLDRGVEIIGANDANAGSTAHFLAFATSAQGQPPAERLRITSAGNVGIGTSSPVHPLSVVGGAESTESKLMSLRSNGTSNGTATTLRFENSSVPDVVNGTAEISAIRDNTGGNGKAGLVFRTSNGITVAENMRIDSAGNVGIGTTSPSSALTVQGTITGTAVTQSNTDTTAGRLTKVGDFGLGGLTSPFWPSGDADDITGAGNGFYNGTPSTGFVSFAPLLYLRRLSTNNAAQMQFGAEISYRNAGTISGNVPAWGAFKEIYSQTNILGTVSQSAGVPTGAIIQRGSNANGEFVRFADGTQICTVVEPSGPNINISSGNIFRSDLVAVTYPATFVGTPSVQVTGRRGPTSAPFPWGTAVDLSTTSTSVVLFNSATTTSSVGFSVTAIGRWF